MEEETTCSNCGRDVPKTLYCIYCGSALFKAEKKSKSSTPKTRTVELKPDPIRPEPIAMEIPLINTVPSPPPPKPETVSIPVVDADVDPEVTELMEEIKKNYIWKVKLSGVLCEGGVSEGVFTRLFDEYVTKINQLSQVRNDRIAYYRGDFTKNKVELEEAERKLEELRVRAAVGQISNSDLVAQSPELEEKINRLRQETSRLDVQLSRLNDLMRGASPREISDLEKTAGGCVESIDTMLTNGKISNRLGNELREDLKAVLNIFDSIIGDKKQRENELRDELSTLEARYKVGEINISEFEGHKRRINADLEQIWL